jgi:hypothetical protein
MLSNHLSLNKKILLVQNSKNARNQKKELILSANSSVDSIANVSGQFAAQVKAPISIIKFGDYSLES